jgi:hypothetical protein
MGNGFMASKNFALSRAEKVKWQTAYEDMKVSIVVIPPPFKLLPLTVPDR